MVASREEGDAGVHLLFSINNLFLSGSAFQSFAVLWKYIRYHELGDFIQIFTIFINIDLHNDESSELKVGISIMYIILSITHTQL